MNKKKPNYAQFMKRPAPLELSPPGDPGDRAPRSAQAPKKQPVREEDLPWGQVIIEFSPDDSVPLDQGPVTPARLKGPRQEDRVIPEGKIIPEFADHRRAKPATESRRVVPLSQSTMVGAVPLPAPVAPAQLPLNVEAPPPVAVMVVGVVVVVALFFAV